jgi:hypothetical protein
MGTLSFYEMRYGRRNTIGSSFIVRPLRHNWKKKHFFE